MWVHLQCVHYSSAPTLCKFDTTFFLSVRTLEEDSAELDDLKPLSGVDGTLDLFLSVGTGDGVNIMGCSSVSRGGGESAATSFSFMVINLGFFKNFSLVIHKLYRFGIYLIIHLVFLLLFVVGFLTGGTFGLTMPT